jgi:hypothetical protein
MYSKRALFGAALAAIMIAPAWADDCGIPGWFLSGDNPAGYTCGTETAPGDAGKSSFIKAKSEAPTGIATLMQQIAADAYRGKRLRLTAAMKTANAGRAQLWMRVDGADRKMLAFYNMDDRPVTGTSDWKPYTVVLDVPQDAAGIAFGYFLGGQGEVWAKDLVLSVVGNDVPVSGAKPVDLPKTPSNLSFDQ